jgi:hypothetical protein
MAVVYRCKRQTKFRNKRVRYDGFLFGSGKEKDRYIELKLLEKSGEIRNLTVHPSFLLVVNGHDVGSYVADFMYRVGSKDVIEDTKGKDERSGWSTQTQLYKLKKKLMKALYGVEVKEI